MIGLLGASMNQSALVFLVPTAFALCGLFTIRIAFDQEALGGDRKARVAMAVVGFEAAKAFYVGLGVLLLACAAASVPALLYFF
jgi:hypothetical protein